jgi:hypothetical protein
MSDQQLVPTPAPRPLRNPWVTALLIIIGMILLLPGLCSLIYMAVLFTDGPGSNSEYLGLLLFCFLVEAGGVALIVFAIRR